MKTNKFIIKSRYRQNTDREIEKVNENFQQITTKVPDTKVE